MNKYEFNPFTGQFDLVNVQDPFGVITTYDCGILSEFNSNYYDEIDCGDLPLSCCSIYDLGDIA